MNISQITRADLAEIVQEDAGLNLLGHLLGNHDDAMVGFLIRRACQRYVNNKNNEPLPTSTDLLKDMVVKLTENTYGVKIR